MSQFCPAFHIDNFAIRIPERLNIKRFGVILDRCLGLRQIKRIDKCRFDTVISECMGKKIICSAVNILCRNNMISCLRHGLECIGHRRCAGGNCQSRHAAFQRRYPLFKNIFRRICQTTVNITGILQRKPCCAVITVSEHIGSCLINRNCPRVRDRIRLFLSNMKCQCLKFQFSFRKLAHRYPPTYRQNFPPCGFAAFFRCIY